MNATSLAVAIGRDTERGVLRSLASGLSIYETAMRTGLSHGAVEEVADRHGHPDRDALTGALAAMDVEDGAGSGAPGGQAGDRQLRAVPVGSLRPDPDNPRDDLGDVEELAESIRSVGLLQPIVARQRAGQLIVVAGHRRLAAVQLLGWVDVDVVVRPDMRPDEVLAAMIVENGHRRDLDPIEEAHAYARLKKLESLTSVELGRRTGHSQAFVDGRLRLLDLAPEDQTAVREGRMGVTAATEKARVVTGKVRPGGGRVPHLGADHTLAGRARARCNKVHGLKRPLVGLTACGQCWESVIRGDERAALTQAAIGATCATCGHPDTTQED